MLNNEHLLNFNGKPQAWEKLGRDATQEVRDKREVQWGQASPVLIRRECVSGLCLSQVLPFRLL